MAKLTLLAAAASLAAFATTADAQSRYGAIADYEGVGDCGAACAVAPVAADRYGTVAAPVVAAPIAAPPVIVDCSQFGAVNCAPTYSHSVVAQPTTVYTQPVAQAPAPRVEIFEQPTFRGETAPCPSGTTAQPDGTCLQGSSFGSSTTYSSSTTFSAPATQMADCPAGTVKQPDGTCAQTATTYSEPVYTPPPVTDAQPSYGYTPNGSFGADTYRPIRK